MSHTPIIQTLRARGAKITKARDAIAAVFARATAPLTAAEVRDALHGSGVRVDKTTVYRELEFLTKNGVIVTVSFGDRNARYERADAAHHHHAVCVKCEAVQDVHADGDLASEERRIARETGFSVLRHSLEFFGLCARCK